MLTMQNKNKKTYDLLIVGAGLFGSTFAYLAKKRGLKCLVIDKRAHAGGNVYCEKREGINVHCYGAHIFHTSDQKVWDFVKSLVRFNRYTNCPVAVAPDGKLYNLPFNMNTFNRLWGVTTPSEAEAILAQQRAEILEHLKRQNVKSPRNLEEQALSLVGRDIYELLIDGYTQKQWGRPCRELPAFIIRRLPVRLTYDNNYFNDRWQGVPVGGYNRLVDAMLDGVEVRLGVDFFTDRQAWLGMADATVFTGRIDEYFDYCYGRLQYRSVRFETESLDVANYQGNAVVNYTSADVPYTRIIEHKHFESFGDEVYQNRHTVISREYPCESADDIEPYYPINDSVNQALYGRYKELADAQSNVLFGGRLAEYKYYDMAPVIAKAISLFELFYKQLL